MFFINSKKIIKTYNKALIPIIIKITPAKISMYFTGMTRSFSPIINPILEFINVIIPISSAGFKIVFLLNKSVTPAENASILVAIANKNKHNKLMHKGFDDFLSKASLINFIPKKTKMVKTIYLAYGAM